MCACNDCTRLCDTADRHYRTLFGGTRRHQQLQHSGGDDDDDDEGDRRPPTTGGGGGARPSLVGASSHGVAAAAESIRDGPRPWTDRQMPVRECWRGVI